MIEVGQIRKWRHTNKGGVFLVVELPDDYPNDPAFVSSWVRYIQDGKECFDKFEWIELSSEVICEAR